MIDRDSPPGSWLREIVARGRFRTSNFRWLKWTCDACGWTGTDASITDASSERVVDGNTIVERTHLAVCPQCFAVLQRAETTEMLPECGS